MSTPRYPDRRLLIAVDMERYGRRENLVQFQSQQIIREVLDEASNAIGLDRSLWTLQHGGDGELAILPAGIPEPTIIGEFVPDLDRRLRSRNRTLIPSAKVRLRIAVHQGLVHLDGAKGFPGEAVVDVCRLCDANPLKRALMAFPHAATALIVSDALYQDVVAQGYAGIRKERFKAIRVEHLDKDFRAPAWIHIPDEDVAQCRDLDRGPGDPGTDIDPPGAPKKSGQRGTGGASPRPHTVERRTQAPVSETFNLDNVTNHGPTVFGSGGQAIGTINHHTP
jgi:hypothetical protein